MWLAISVLILGLGVRVCLHAHHLIGDHVCPQEEKYTVTVERFYKKNVTIREFVWCMGLPPRCSKYNIVEKDFNRIEEEIRIRKIDKCCHGYEENENKTTCIPICNECINGVCNESIKKCECSSGFMGSSCNQTCPAGKWGSGCIQKCECTHAHSCDIDTGYCRCYAPWTGAKCEISLNSSNCTINNCNTTSELITKNTTDEGVLNVNNFTSIDTSIQELKNNNTPEMNDQSFNENSDEETTTIYQNQTQTYPPMVIAIEDIRTTEMNMISKKNFNASGKAHQSSDDNNENSEHWLMMDDFVQITNNNNNLDTSSSNYSILLFSISITLGLILILIFIAILSVSIARYKKKRNFITKGRSNRTKSSSPVDTNENRLSTQPIIRHCIFHTPLPDPPTFQNPVFSLTSNSDQLIIKKSSSKFYCISEVKNDLQYDYPPSTGSYRAASIPEPEDNDPVYDEIPINGRPRPVILQPLTSGICVEEKCDHKCINSEICEWHRIT